MVVRKFGLILLLAASPAWGEPLVRDIFPQDDTCYLRVYSRTHLASHPAQRVNQISLRPDLVASTDGMLALRVAVVLRNQSPTYEGVAYCKAPKGQVDCGIEGDGGGFQLQMDGTDLRLTVAAEGVSLESPQAFTTLSGTDGDDRVFILRPADPIDCR